MTYHCKICASPIPPKKYRVAASQIKNMVCKPCHGEISRKNGRVPSIVNNSIDISDNQMSVIIGSALGDGSFEKTPGYGTYALSVKHGLKQEQYCKWKAQFLGELVKGVGYPKDRIRFRTKRHNSITELANQFGLPGRKSPPASLVLTPLAVAIWYLDDGSVSWAHRSKSGRPYKTIVRISSCSFTEQENLILRDKLESMFGIKTFKCQWKISKKYAGEKLETPKRVYGIGIRGEHANIFLKKIRESLPEGHGMSYKLDPEVARSARSTCAGVVPAME